MEERQRRAGRRGPAKRDYRTQDSSARRRARRRRRRIRRKIQAWAARILVLAVVILASLLTLRGAMALWHWFAGDSQGKEVFFAGNSPDAMLVVVDAGHGGEDPGTCSGDILEKDINLTVALKVAEKLSESGVRVMMTRTEDVKVDLEERARIANQAKADIFISIHCNYYEDSTKTRGLECYYKEGSAEGEALANRISEEFETTDKVVNRGVKTADYRVLRKTKMQAVLVELGYMSNPEECKKLAKEDYQELLAEKIAAGILKEDSAEGQ